MTTINHPFLKLDPKYLYSGYKYKISFERTESRYNYKRHTFESHHNKFETSAIFDHQTEKFYVFRSPNIRILKENLLNWEVLDYVG